METRQSVERINKRWHWHITIKKLQRFPNLKNSLSFKVRRRSPQSHQQEQQRERRRSESEFVPRYVSEGHLAVYAAKEGCRQRRFIIPVDYLKHSVFKDLLRLAEEEFGFDYNDGALTIPCEPLRLEEIINGMKDSQGRGGVTANSAPYNKLRSSLSTSHFNTVMVN